MKNKLLLLSGASLLLISFVVPFSKVNNQEEVGKDNISYEELRPIDRKDLVYVNNEDEEEEDVNSPKKVVLHYHNDDGANADRRFYVWNAIDSGIEYEYDHISSDGKDMDITLDFINDERFKNFYGLEGMFFIIKVKDIWAGQSDDTYIDYSLFPPDGEGVTTVWSIPGEGSSIDLYKTEAETKLDKIETAVFSNWKQIALQSTIAPERYNVYAYTASYFKMSNEDQATYKKNYLFTSGVTPQTKAVSGSSSVTWNIDLRFTIHINVRYVVEAYFKTAPDKAISKVVSYDRLYDTKRFETYYTYNGNDLGATVSTEDGEIYTTFKVWAPTASFMKFLLYPIGTPKAFGGSNGYFPSNMTYQPGGIWAIKFKGDFYGSYYNYFVYGTGGNYEVVDPYAKACGVNGLRGMVVNFDETNPEGWDLVPDKWDKEAGFDIAAPNELSVYEVHIRDLTQHETWQGTSKRGTYSAFAEKGTTYTKGDVTVKTGFDHIEELGVKAIQILPFFDHDDNEIDQNEENNDVDIDFNWGYNPLNYNCLEGGYATDPFDGQSRITEFKNLVKAYALNANHTRVIMDVVYNHVSSGPASSFTKLMPKYYFRYAANGSYYNGSGCGNEVKTEAPMMRKYIVESLKFWASEYKIKGFRFDLMGLIDTDTLKLAAQELYKIDPDIVMYGEGWRGDGDSFHGKGSPAETGNVYSQLYATNDRVAVGGFNDAGRNAIRGGNDGGWGSTTALPGLGYMSKYATHSNGSKVASSEDRDCVADMLWGIHRGKGANPIQTVNYASCHDNWTLFDQFYYTLGDQNNTKPYTIDVINASVATHAFIMMSNGIAFMQGGEELFRTKELTEADRKEVTKDTYENMYGRYVSHNSYNAPASVNAFNWSRKIQIEDIDTTQFCKAFETVIKLHNTLPKYQYEDGNFPYKQTSAGKKIDGLSWAGSYKGSSVAQSYQGCSGFQLDEYFVFLAGRQWGWVQFGDVPLSTKVFEFGPNEFDNVNGTVNVGSYQYDKGGAIVIYKRGA